MAGNQITDQLIQDGGPLVGSRTWTNWETKQQITWGGNCPPYMHGCRTATLLNLTLTNQAEIRVLKQALHHDRCNLQRYDDQIPARLAFCHITCLRLAIHPITTL